MSRPTLSLLPVLLLAGCSWMRAPRIPMPHAAHAAPSEPRGLVVLLPGVGDRPEAFEQHGFVERIHALDPSLDVVVADAHLGYYLGEIVSERVHHDVVARRLEGGTYDRVWLVGISLGGLGAMAYAADYPHRVDGVILLAPYLGPPAVVDEIRAAGSLAAWRPQQLAHYDGPTHRLSHAAWRWWRDVAARPAEMPRVFLGYGDDDEFRDAHELLAKGLPADRLATVPGGHSWAAWRPLFDTLLPRALGADRTPELAAEVRLGGE